MPLERPTSLPPDLVDLNLVDLIAYACKLQDIAEAPVVEAVRQMVSTDDYIDYWVWGGAGDQDEENMLLDIIVLGRRCVYNYTKVKGGWAQTTTLLKNIEAVQLRMREHPRIQCILEFRVGTRGGTVYGTMQDVDRLMSFRDRLIQASLAAQASGGGS